MSADGQRKAYRYTCNMIRPQIYSEKSLMESVVDFFSDVVPQAYSGTQKVEDKEKIQWVRFENCDCNDISKNPDLYRSDTKGLPLLLILGYSNGVQIWHVTSNGEAQEILSIRQGPVRIFRILPIPEPALGYQDAFVNKRPLAVMCDSSSAGQPYCGIKFVSLKTGDEVHSINYKTLPVQTIECNKRFLAVVFLEKICVYEACQFQQLFWVTSCYPCPGPTVNPMSMSTRWLAYADKRLVAMHQSCGGMSGDGAQSYAATVISAAKGAFKGLSMFGEAMVNSVTGCKAPGVKKQDLVHIDNGNRPGIVTVVDIQTVHNDQFNVNEDNEGSGLIAHFHAHANEPVANMAFDSTGTLLVTACKLGHNFHVFRLMAHPCTSSLGAVHHLYTLHRGDTTAKVTDISFNHDSRWVTVSTHRGTTHIFPITPYGGPINVRTHCQPHIVNRASRFHKSAGLEDIERSPIGRRSPVLSTSPSSSGQYDRYPTLIQQNTLNNNMGNPRLPPYPHPITIYPLFQIKQPLNVVLNPSNKNQSPSHSPTGLDNVYAVCAKFSSPRLCVIGSPKLDMDRREGGRRPVDSLFIMTQSGTLVEYVLEPKARAVLDKATEDCTLDLAVAGRMQWSLQRLKASQELRPPLPSNSPLLLANEAVLSQIPTAADLCDHIGLTRQDSKDSLSSDHSNKDDDEQWLSQVEIITHAGPHRRLWMGPQFSFKTYQENTTVLSSNSSALLSQSPETNLGAMDITGDEGDLESLKVQPTRSNPVTMPTTRPAYRRLSGSDSSPSPGLGQITPLMIEAGSFDQSPHLLDVYSNWTESTVEKQPRSSDDLEEDRLKQTLADAMVESPIKDIDKLSLRQDITRSCVTSGKKKNRPGVQKDAKEQKPHEKVVKLEEVSREMNNKKETGDLIEDKKAAILETTKGNKKASRQKTDGKGKTSRTVQIKETRKLDDVEKPSTSFATEISAAEVQTKVVNKPDKISRSDNSTTTPSQVSVHSSRDERKLKVNFVESEKEKGEMGKSEAGKKTSSSKDKQSKEVEKSNEGYDNSKEETSVELNKSVDAGNAEAVVDNDRDEHSLQARKSPSQHHVIKGKEDRRDESHLQTKKIPNDMKHLKESSVGKDGADKVKSKSARKKLSDSYFVADDSKTNPLEKSMEDLSIEEDLRLTTNTNKSCHMSSVSRNDCIREDTVHEAKQTEATISDVENKIEANSPSCSGSKTSSQISDKRDTSKDPSTTSCEPHISTLELPKEPSLEKESSSDCFQNVKDKKKKKKKNGKKSEIIKKEEEVNNHREKVSDASEHKQNINEDKVIDALTDESKTKEKCAEKENVGEMCEEDGGSKSIDSDTDTLSEMTVKRTTEETDKKSVLDNNSNNKVLNEDDTNSIALSSEKEGKSTKIEESQLGKKDGSHPTLTGKVGDESENMIVVRTKKKRKKKTNMEESQYFDATDDIKEQSQNSGATIEILDSKESHIQNLENTYIEPNDCKIGENQDRCTINKTDNEEEDNQASEWKVTTERRKGQKQTRENIVITDSKKCQNQDSSETTNSRKGQNQDRQVIIKKDTMKEQKLDKEGIDIMDNKHDQIQDRESTETTDNKKGQNQNRNHTETTDCKKGQNQDLESIELIDSKERPKRDRETIHTADSKLASNQESQSCSKANSEKSKYQDRQSFSKTNGKKGQNQHEEDIETINSKKGADQSSEGTEKTGKKKYQIQSGQNTNKIDSKTHIDKNQDIQCIETVSNKKEVEGLPKQTNSAVVISPDKSSVELNVNETERTRLSETRIDNEIKSKDVVQHKEADKGLCEDEMFVVKSKRKKKKKKGGMEESVYDVKIDDSSIQENESSVYLEATAFLPSIITDNASEKSSNTKIYNDFTENDHANVKEAIGDAAELNRGEIETAIEDEGRISTTQASCEDMDSDITVLSRSIRTPAADSASSWETAAMGDIDEDSKEESADIPIKSHMKEASSCEGMDVASGTSLTNNSDRSSEERDAESKTENSSERSSEERETKTKADSQKSDGKNKKKKRKNRK